MPLSVGDKLGPYEILAPIGAGGMGEVYRARDPRLNRDVALKVSAAQFSDRFEREAKAIAALNHPNICQIYDVGPDYLVMEYVEGSPLKGPLPLDQTLKYAAQICDALDAAHRKGITHRDLKPANILVTRQGIKLLDFGLARIASADQTLTIAGTVMGTPAYMSPEQWEGKPGDARSDIYAFGCVLYEMLTGKRAAQERSAVGPVAIEHVILRCLAKDPDERWQSARDLRGLLDLPMVRPTPPARNPWRERAAWIAAVVVFAAIGAFFASRTSHPQRSSDLVSFEVYPPEKTAFSPQPNTTVSVPQFALSPDGHSIALVASAAGAAPMVWVRPLAEVAARRLPDTENAQDPFWSPDSRWIGFFADGKVKRVPADGGAVQFVAETTEFRGGSWSADDTILFTGGNTIRQVRSVGGTTTPVPGTSAGVTRYPHFLPDRRHFLYTYSSAQGTGVYASTLDGQTRKLVVPLFTSAVYAPAGYLLFVNGDTLMGQAFDAERLEVSGQPFLVAEHAGHNTALLGAITVSHAGSIAYSGALFRNGRLTWFDRGGNSLTPAGPEGDYTDFRLSPNERSLAVSLLDAKPGNVDVWMNDLGRNGISRFASGGAVTASPLWSPDGARVAYRSVRGGIVEFFERSAGGGGAEKPVLTFENERTALIQSPNLVPTDWSPDGGHLLFSVPAPASANDLWMLPLAGDKKPFKYLATSADEMHGNFSPDGHLVAYTSNESGKFEVYAETFPRSDRKWPVSTGGGYEPRWRADGREIYYLSEDRKLMAVSVGAGPQFGVPVPLFQTRVPAGVTANRTNYVPSRDGKRFLVNTQSGEPPPTPITVVLNWTAGLKK
jgi:eukaryotic-like serine/threonine-protein kinase